MRFVNRFAVYLHPFADVFQTIVGIIVPIAVGAGTDVEQEISAL